MQFYPADWLRHPETIPDSLHSYDPETIAMEMELYYDDMLPELRQRMNAYDERTAMMVEGWDDGKSASEHAAEALERPERFNGEHDVARAQLHSDPEARIFRKVKDS